MTRTDYDKLTGAPVEIVVGGEPMEVRPLRGIKWVEWEGKFMKSLPQEFSEEIRETITSGQLINLIFDLLKKYQMFVKLNGKRARPIDFIKGDLMKTMSEQAPALLKAELPKVFDLAQGVMLTHIGTLLGGLLDYVGASSAEDRKKIEENILPEEILPAVMGVAPIAFPLSKRLTSLLADMAAAGREAVRSEEKVEESDNGADSHTETEALSAPLSSS